MPALAADNPPCSQFKFYAFAQYWMPTLCLKENSALCAENTDGNGWVIHGLWPDSDTSAGDLVYCPSRKFYVDDLEDILPQLQSAWPNPITEKRDTDRGNRGWLWRHEWYKHGACAMKCDTSIGSMNDYFDSAINIHQQFNVAEALEKARIGPGGDGQNVETAKIRRAIRVKFGVEPTVKCFNDKNSKKSYLFDVTLCLDPTTRQAIACPKHASGTGELCPAEVIYPHASD
ncbi:MAG: hypothetical protein GY789_04390 [Hyphomicrobiales bacterium]|nr:hypothetical protein [Hyphomicrobiales bacterium]